MSLGTQLYRHVIFNDMALICSHVRHEQDCNRQGKPHREIYNQSVPLDTCDHCCGEPGISLFGLKLDVSGCVGVLALMLIE